MPLSLKIVSAHRESMGGAYAQEFVACGGTIGRSLECDWPLPDSKRYISSRHALIDYQGGAYHLVDLSRNGTYINGSNAPVGKGNTQRLYDGDIIRLGEFVITASISPDEQQEDCMRDSIVRAQMVQIEDSMEYTMLPADSIHNANVLDDALTPGDDSGELSALRDVRAGDKENRLKTEVMAAATDEFLRTAGLNPADFRGIEPDILLQNAARLLSEFTEGTHALLADKQRTMRGLRINDASDAGNSNPLRHSDGIDNAMRLLLAGSGDSDVHISGPRAVESAFNELIQHQKALVSAMRNALGEFIDNFEPERLEQIFEENRVRTGTSKSRQVFIEAYAQAFAWLEQRDPDRVPRRFDEEFAKAYLSATAD